MRATRGSWDVPHRHMRADARNAVPGGRTALLRRRARARALGRRLVLKARAKATSELPDAAIGELAQGPKAEQVQ